MCLGQYSPRAPRFDSLRRPTQVVLALAIGALCALEVVSAQPLAFISGPFLSENLQMLVLDTSDDTLVAEIRLGESFGYAAIAFSDLPDRVFLGPQAASQIEVVGLRQPLRRGVLPLTRPASWLDVLPDGSKAYVSHREGIDVVDFESGETSLIVEAADGSAQGVAVDSAGDRVYVAVSGLPSTLLVIDPEIDQPTASLDLPGASESLLGVVVHPDDSRVYIADFNEGSVLVVDVVAGRLVTTIPVPGPARAPTLSPLGERLFVTTTQGVAVIDTITNTVTDTLLTGAFTTAVDVHPDGSRVYVMDGASGLVSSFTADSLRLIKSLPTSFIDPLRSREFIAPLAD